MACRLMDDAAVTHRAPRRAVPAPTMHDGDLEIDEADVRRLNTTQFARDELGGRGARCLRRSVAWTR